MTPDVYRLIGQNEHAAQYEKYEVNEWQSNHWIYSEWIIINHTVPIPNHIDLITTIHFLYNDY